MKFKVAVTGIILLVCGIFLEAPNITGAFIGTKGNPSTGLGWIIIFLSILVLFLGISWESDEEYKSKAKMIRDAKSFRELFEALYKIGSIQGTQKTYSPQELEAIIAAVHYTAHNHTFVARPGDERSERVMNYMDKLRKATWGKSEDEATEEMLSHITRTYGIRDKVRELLSKE
jgi:hypothetical protein